MSAAFAPPLSEQVARAIREGDYDRVAEEHGVVRNVPGLPV